MRAHGSWRSRQLASPFLPLMSRRTLGILAIAAAFISCARDSSAPSVPVITLVVKSDWRDASGAPLKAEFRRQYRVGPPDERPLQPAAWRVSAPAFETRDALTVTSPEPLDRALA